MRIDLVVAAGLIGLAGCATKPLVLAEMQHALTLPPADRAIYFAESPLRYSNKLNREHAYRSAYSSLKSSAAQISASGDLAELQKLQNYFNSRPDLQEAARKYNADFFSVASFKAIADTLNNDKEKIRLDLETLLAGQPELIGAADVKLLRNKIQIFLDKKASVLVSSSVWDEIGADDRQHLNSQLLVEALPSSGLATIIDAQTVDISTAPTSSGAQLGSAVASAAYVDNAFKGPAHNWNYSAKGQLAAGIVGAVAGSVFDSRGGRLYLHRYTLKKLDGSIHYHESHEVSPLRHPLGLCFFLPRYEVVNQNLCSENAAGFKTRVAAIIKESQH